MKNLVVAALITVEFGGSCAHNNLQHEYVNLLQDQDSGRFASGK